MASAGPVAIFIFLSVLGALVLPVCWLLLAYFSKKLSLKYWPKVFLGFSIIPVASLALIFLSRDIDYVSSKSVLLIYFITPIINIVALVSALIVLTLIWFGRRKC